MYKVDINTVPGYIGMAEDIPDKIRTVSVMSARVILTDEHDHMYSLSPGSIKELIIRPVKDGD